MPLSEFFVSSALPPPVLAVILNASLKMALSMDGGRCHIEEQPVQVLTNSFTKAAGGISRRSLPAGCLAIGYVVFTLATVVTIGKILILFM